MPTQTKQQARGSNNHLSDTTDNADKHLYDTERQSGDDTGLEAATAAATTVADHVREVAAENSRQLQDSMLSIVRQGRDTTLAMLGRGTDSTDGTDGTDTGGPPALFGLAPAQARAAISGGYDLFEQLLAGQRRFVDGMLSEQRRFVESLLTPPGDR